MAEESITAGRRFVVELLGTAQLLAVVVGSRIMGDRLASGVAGVTFLVNTAATGGVYAALTLSFGALSGAHFNPAVSFASFLRGSLTLRSTGSYVLAQLLGAFLGIGVTLLVFGHPAFHWSNPPRATVTEIAGELLAAFGLVCVFLGSRRAGSTVSAVAVGAYLASTYWFTESTSFANPAVTIAKGLTSTSSSIHPHDVGLILSAQLLGAAAAGLLFKWLLPEGRRVRARPTVVFASTAEDGWARLAADELRALVRADAVEIFAAVPLAEGAPLRPGARALDEALLARADVVVTVGAVQDWDALVSRSRIHWSFPVTTSSDAQATELREALKARVRILSRELGIERLSPAMRAALSPDLRTEGDAP